MASLYLRKTSCLSKRKNRWSFKYQTLALCMLTLCSIDANAFSRGLFRETNIKEKAFGLTLGVLGWQDDQPTAAIGFSLQFFGVYFDLMGLPAAHSDDIGTEVWVDDTSFATHIGYQLPITKSVRIIPIIGTAFWGTATVDGAHWSIVDGHVHNETNYNPDGGDGLDYGGILVIHHKKWNFSAIYTNHTVSLGTAITW